MQLQLMPASHRLGVQDYCRCSFSPALEARNCWTFVTEILNSCCGLHFTKDSTPLLQWAAFARPAHESAERPMVPFHRSIKKFLRPSRLWHGGAAAFIWVFAARTASCCKKPCPCVASFKSYSLPTYSLVPLSAFISVVVAFEEVQHKTCECGQRDGPNAQQKV